MSFRRKFWFRFLVFLVVLLGLLAGAGFMYVRHLLDHLNPRLEAALAGALGVPVTLGRSSIDFQRGLGIAVHDVQIARSGDCVSPLKIREVSLRADLWELLHRNIIIDRLTIEGLKVRLSVNSNGDLQLLSEDTTACTPLQTAPASVATPVSTASAEPAAEIPLNLQFNSIGIVDLDAEVRLPKGSIVLNDLAGEAGLQLENDKVKLDSLHLKCSLQKKGFALDIKQLLLGRSDSRLTLDDFQVKLGAAGLQGSATLQFLPGAIPGVQGTVNVTDVRAELQELGVMLASVGVSGFPADVRGSVKGAFSTTLAANNTLQGNMSLNNFAKGKNLAVSQAVLSNVRLEGKNLVVEKASVEAALSGFSAKDGVDDYTFQSARGTIAYSGAKGWQISSNKLSFAGFGYSDRETVLSDVTADLLGLLVSNSAQGDIEANLRLSGTKLRLRHFDLPAAPQEPDLEIKQIAAVEAPVRVRIPSRGGYEISGPLSVQGGSMIWQKRDFQNISGSVTTLISGPLKKFSANPLKFSMGKESASLRGAFEMTEPLFKLPDLSLTLAGGSSTGSFSLGRNGNKPLKASLVCKTVDVGRVIRMVSPKDEGSFVGVLQQGNVSLEASWQDLKGSATGSGFVEIREGDLKKFDFTRVLGNALSAIPGVSVGQGGASQATGPERPAQTSKVNFTIQPRVVLIPSLELQREDYSVRGKGTVGFDGQVSLAARVTFLKERLGMLGSGLQAVSGLLGGLGRIDVPITISGMIPDVAINVDMATFLREKSGLSTAESVISTTGDIIGGVGRALWSPFSGSNSPSK